MVVFIHFPGNQIRNHFPMNRQNFQTFSIAIMGQWWKKNSYLSFEKAAANLQLFAPSYSKLKSFLTPIWPCLEYNKWWRQAPPTLLLKKSVSNSCHRFYPHLLIWSPAIVELWANTITLLQFKWTWIKSKWYYELANFVPKFLFLSNPLERCWANRLLSDIKGCRCCYTIEDYV